MIRSLSRPSPTGRLVLAAPLLALALAACGGSNSGASVAPSGTGGNAEASAGAGPSASGGQRQQPGVSGQTAAISGDTLQVRTSDGQTAVQFTASTRITQQKAATAASVKVGECLVATGSPDAAGTGLTAQTVTISPASGTTGCTADAGGRGFGGPGASDGPGGGGFGAGSGAPRASRTAQPGQGAPSGAPTTPVSTALGTVKAVTATSVTVDGQLRTFSRQSPGSTPGASPTGASAPRTVTVTLASTTRYTSTVTVKSSALAVGQCVTAVGQANDIGAVAARSIAIRPASSDGTCSTGFGGFGGRRGAAGSTAASSGATNG
jgi:hypothetical protein